MPELGQTVEKPKGQPGKKVSREFLRAQPEWTLERQFFQDAPMQSGTFETLRSLKQKPKGAFRFSLGNRLEKLPCGKTKVCYEKDYEGAA